MGNKYTSTRHFFNRGRSVYWDNYPINDTVAFTDVFDRKAADNPKFESLIKSGANATNDMVVKAQSTFYSRPRVVLQWQSKQYNAYRLGQQIETTVLNCAEGFGSHTYLPGTLFMADVDNKALIGIIKKIRKHETSDFSGPTFAGELRETIHMLRHPFQALRLQTGLFTDLHMRILRDRNTRRRGKRAYVDKWSKVISDTWLEWTFGAAPLISDIKSILDLYLDRKARLFPGGLQRLSYRFTDDYHDLESSGLDMIWTGTDFRWKYNRARHYQGGVQYVVWIDNSFIFHGDSAVDQLLDLSKVRLDEILPTAWELMPWSFLIDYFTNIGDVLGSTFNYNRNVVFGKRSSVQRCVRFDIPLETRCTDAAKTDFVVTAEPWSYTSSYTRVDRGKISTLRFPQLSVNLPSVGQAINIAALFRSLQQRNPFKGQTLS